MDTQGLNWSLLSDADKAVLKQLGIVEPVPQTRQPRKPSNPITVERRLSTRNTAPEPYFVKVFKTCSCCKTKTTTRGKMDKRKLSDSYLSLIIQDIPEGELFRQLAVTSVTCENCLEVLSQLSVDELVHIIKALHEIQAKKCLP